MQALDGADLGLAFDGDGDRVLAVDGDGTPIDGDQILAICALDLRARGALPGDAVVTTTMTNLGFRRAMAPRASRCAGPTSATGTCSRRCAAADTCSAGSRAGT